MATEPPNTVATQRPRKQVAAAGTPLARPRTQPRAPAPASAQITGKAHAILHAVAQVDSSYLESLLGYNARRAALAAIDVFLPGMAAFGLRPVDFSVLSLTLHNPGITSRQLCASLGLQPPNLVPLVARLQKRGLLLGLPHPIDGRAIGLHPTPAGQRLMREAEATATELEGQVASRLSPTEQRTLIKLLQKVYRPGT